jgi:putative Mn2+ efflux pump MntP
VASEHLLLVGTVVAVGVLHTIVPDHWAPIVILARQGQWSMRRTMRVAAFAGIGHVVTTLLIGLVLWVAGAAIATRYAHAVNIISAFALIGFGAWIAYTGWREAQGIDHHHHDEERHVGRGTALMLVLGSSPMIEGLPAFLAASTKGAVLLGVMAVAFAISTIATYAIMCALGVRGLQSASLGPLERYGEMLSGVVVAAVGLYALITS